MATKESPSAVQVAATQLSVAVQLRLGHNLAIAKLQE